MAPGSILTTPQGPPKVRLSGPPRAQLRALRGGADRLLTVREVAEHLSMSTATVYKLCEIGELGHVRVSNAIRIAPSDLTTYVSLRRR